MLKLRSTKLWRLDPFRHCRRRCSPPYYCRQIYYLCYLTAWLRRFKRQHIINSCHGRIFNVVGLLNFRIQRLSGNTTYSPSWGDIRFLYHGRSLSARKNCSRSITARKAGGWIRILNTILNRTAAVYFWSYMCPVATAEASAVCSECSSVFSSWYSMRPCELQS